MRKSFSLIMIILLWILSLSQCGYLTPQHVEQHIKRLISQKYQLYVINLGQTVNNNSLKAYVISGIKKQQSSITDLLHYPATLITSYMHPRQPYSIKLMQTVLDDVLNNYQTDYYFRYMLDNTLLILFPFVNIDGYYLYQKLIEENASKREKQSYRKNLNKYGKCPHEWQYGVDINRNFDSAWGSLRTSDIQCGQQYRGPNPFSQKQSRAIRTLYSKFKITLAIDIHSYGNQWIYPYASQATNEKFHKHELYPLYNNLFDQFKKLKRPMKGCFESLGYTADGVYIDWALDQGALSLAVQIGKSFDGDVDIGNQILFQTEQLFHTVLRKNSISYKKYLTRKENSLVIKSTSLLSFDIQVLISNGTSLGVKRLQSRQIVIYKLPNELTIPNQVTLKVIDTRIEQHLQLQQLQKIQSLAQLKQLDKKSSSQSTTTKGIISKTSQLLLSQQFDTVTIVIIVTSMVATIFIIVCCIKIGSNNNNNKKESISKGADIQKQMSPIILQQTVMTNDYGIEEGQQQNHDSQKVKQKVTNNDVKNIKYVEQINEIVHENDGQFHQPATDRMLFR